MMMKRIVVASCDAKFYAMGRELIDSVRRTSAEVVREIVFFDLGLTADQRAEMERMEGVRLVDYPGWLKDVYEDFLTPRMFAWKTYAMKAAAELGESILYMDCGCVALRNLRPLFEKIEQDGAFFLRDVHRNHERTHDACFSIMEASEAEQAGWQICAGVMGYVAGGAYQAIFDKGFEYAKRRECIFGDAVWHRHDQSIYSVLVVRHGFEGVTPYGPLVHWKGIESREQIVWQHRGKWLPFKRLRDRGNISAAGRRIALYGAGRHTERFLATFRHVLEPRHQVVRIVDDAPQWEEMGGLPIVKTGDWKLTGADVVVVSSDAHEAAMLERARGAFAGAEVWGVYTEG